MTAAFPFLSLPQDDTVLASVIQAPSPPARLPHLLVPLRHAQDALTQASCPIEPAMIVVGEHLMSAIEGLNQVTETFERLPNELDSPEVQEASGRLAEVAETLAAIADALGDERGALDALAEMTHQVGRQTEKLHKTVAAVGVLAINARIEAAQLRADREDFSVFTVEIGRLARTSGDAVQKFVDELQRLEMLLRAAYDNQAEFETRYALQLRGASKRLQESLSAVGEHRRCATRAANEIGNGSKRIGEGIASSVRALQIGDITRQRLEHVARAVSVFSQTIAPEGDAHAEANAGAPEDWCASLSPEQREMVVAMACRLQSAQVQHAVGDFDRDVALLIRTLQSLAGNARGIVQLGRDRYGAAHGRNSFLTDLTKELGVAESLIATSQVARQKVDDVAQSAEQTLAGLVAQVEAIRAVEMDMRLVGLNTALKCGRLGKVGRTLSVIAQELRGYANQTVEDAQAVMAGLREVVVTAEALRRREVEQSAARMAGLEHSVNAAITTLDATDAGMSGALATLEQEGERVAGLLAETAAGITVHDALGRICQGAVQWLNDAATACHVPDEDTEIVRDKVLLLLQGHYTMASERDLHDLLFGPDDTQGTAPATCDQGASGSSASTEEALDAILF